MTNIALAQQIKNIRVKANLSQDRFGKKIGISGKSVSSYENGHCTPSMRVLDAIAKTYNTPILSMNNDKRIDMDSKIRVIQEYLNEVKELLTL